jgi:hypothetical protein
MDWGFIAGLVVIFLLVVSPLVYFGIKISKHVQKHDPDSELVVRITPVGNVLTACLVGLWGACVIAVKLAPKSALGVFLGTTDGVLAVIVGSIFFYAVSASVLEKVGHPIMKRGSRDT